MKSGKFSGADEIADVKVTEVIGDATDLAVHEQKTIEKAIANPNMTVKQANEAGIIMNKVNAVGPARAGEMGRTITIGRTFGH